MPDSRSSGRALRRSLNRFIRRTKNKHQKSPGDRQNQSGQSRRLWMTTSKQPHVYYNTRGTWTQAKSAPRRYAGFSWLCVANRIRHADVSRAAQLALTLLPVFEQPTIMMAYIQSNPNSATNLHAQIGIRIRSISRRRFFSKAAWVCLPAIPNIHIKIHAAPSFPRPARRFSIKKTTPRNFRSVALYVFPRHCASRISRK